MKNVLYITNIEAPYRTLFFNELGKYCNLTVLYERRKSDCRDISWTNGINENFRTKYLDGFNIRHEFSFSTRIFNIISEGYDTVIIGCYNSLVQICAIIAMKLKGIRFIINLDGEQFIGTNWKSKIKKLILNNSIYYLVAGKKAGISLEKVIGGKIIVPYFFSSINDKELKINARTNIKRNNKVLVIGQYFDYKGMDVALQVARKDTSILYEFVGMGMRTDLFVKEMGIIPKNVTIIPFLQKHDLNLKYQNMGMLLLPSRQECWGLVVNEAASFGMPIVSTLGSGAAVEFLSDRYSHFLAKLGDSDSLYECVKKCLLSDNSEYSSYLKNMSGKYSIEKSVNAHIRLIEHL